jgi:hypothetical protein
MSVDFTLRSGRQVDSRRVRSARIRRQPTLENLEERTVMSAAVAAAAVSPHDFVQDPGHVAALVHSHRISHLRHTHAVGRGQIGRIHIPPGAHDAISGNPSVPFTGTGALSIANFAVNQAGQLVANGTLTMPNGTTQPVQALATLTQSPATATLALPTQTVVPILHLDIQPINLDLLGLQVKTSEIKLDVNAVPGPGNLLGNLLAGVANLLNGPGLLNLNLVASTLNSEISSLGSGGAAVPNVPLSGILSGPLNINSFSLGQNPATGANQLLANGTFGQTPVSLPVNLGSTMTNLLHLDLGPINLNLLGLQVTTNEIILDINAVRGPGKLLGNLLSDVANLLNGSSNTNLLNTLIGDLNRLLG